MFSFNIIVVLAILATCMANDSGRILGTIKPMCPKTPSFECGMKTSSRIISGETAKPHEFPWQVLLTKYLGNNMMSNFCGGTIIGRYHILTAAHCFVDEQGKQTEFPGDFIVRVGAHMKAGKMENEVSHEVACIISHPQFGGPNFNRDISVLLLKEKIVFNEWATPACLPQQKQSDYNGKKLTASGWGDMEHNGSPEKLQHVDLTGMAREECKKKSKKFTKFMLCAIGKGETEWEFQGTCSGDSGGPLTQTENGKTTVVGVTSFGRLWKKYGALVCGIKGAPAFFAKVDEFMEWIISTGVYEDEKPNCYKGVHQCPQR